MKKQSNQAKCCMTSLRYFPKEISRWPVGILNDTKYCYYWRTENQNYHELPPHTCLSDHR